MLKRNIARMVLRKYKKQQHSNFNSLSFGEGQGEEKNKNYVIRYKNFKNRPIKN